MKAVAAFFALCSIATPALCQQETDTGSHIAVPLRARIPDDAKSPVDKARITVSQFARCVVARNPRGVSLALDMLPNLKRGQAMAELATSECLNDGELKIPQIIMRGAIFVELYRLYVTKQQKVYAPQPLVFGDLLGAEFRADPSRFAVLEFGDCVIKRDPIHSKDVVVLATASKAQDAAFKALIPNLGPCVVTGQNVTFSKAVIEGTLAEVLYREALTPVSAVGSK